MGCPTMAHDVEIANRKQLTSSYPYGFLKYTNWNKNILVEALQQRTI